MKRTILATLALLSGLSTVADGHFALIYPAASLLQNRLGDPQKIGPCGGVSANPGRARRPTRAFPAAR